MAQRTGLIFLRLVVERRDGRRRRVDRKRVAFKAEQIYLAALQQARII